MGKRKRTPIHLAIRPELLRAAQEQSINLSRLLESAIETRLTPIAIEAEDVDVPTLKQRIADSPVRHDIIIVAEDEDWEPSDRRLAEQVQAELCVDCEEAGICAGPCAKFRSAYESR